MLDELVKEVYNTIIVAAILIGVILLFLGLILLELKSKKVAKLCFIFVIILVGFVICMICISLYSKKIFNYFFENLIN